MQFQDLLPWFNLPSYSFPIDRGVYITICSSLHTAALCTVSNLDIDRLSSRLGKKVSLAAICLVAGSTSFGLREN
jgi:hypothetical protein